MSRHCPVWVKLKLGSLPIRKPSSKWVPKHPTWSRATVENKDAYKQYLENRLLQLQDHVEQTPLLTTCLKCENLHCMDTVHSEVRDSHMLDLLTAIIEASHLTLPTHGGCWVGEKRPGVSIPGWSREVKPYRDDSLHWGNLWRRAGRPNTGWLHDIYVAARRQYHYAVLRVKRRRKEHQAEELLVAAMNGDVRLLKEMKKIRKGRHSGSNELPDNVGGSVGEQNIAELFRKSYENLYNSAPSGAEMAEMKTMLEDVIALPAKEEVTKVTGGIVKEAVAKLKPNKTDVSGSYVSDALKNAPDLLYDQLASVFRSWLYHGTVTPSLLACSFLPLLKSSLKDPSDPSSYRAIAGSSLMLKTFELVVLLLWGHILSSDSLQFGYKAKTSTTHCTWLVTEVVQHMLRGGINPIVTVLDCSKAFDKCKFSLLFKRLLDKGLPPIVVRVLAFIYMEQYSWVKWGEAKSSQMKISNGTRQGAILSPIFWAVYADPLLQRLRALGLGAHVAGLFMGAVCYADDVLLIAPTRSAMQRMLAELEAFAAESNIAFSTDPTPAKSKTKCIYVVGNKRHLAKPSPLMLCGRELPYVSHADHLGNMLTEKGDMEQDAVIKRAKFINSSVEIREVFKFAAPAEVVKSLKIHSNSFYGSCLWNLDGDKAKQVYTAWNTSVKLAWGCPQQTRTYFLQLVQEVAQLDPWTTSYGRLKSALIAEEQVEVQPLDRWRLPYLRTLLSQRRKAFNLALEDEEKRLDVLISSLVIIFIRSLHLLLIL